MKRIFRISILSMLSLGFIISCTKDVCEGISCNGNGTTVQSADGKSCSCSCNVGYTGTNCDGIDMTKFASATFDVKETGATSTSNYVITSTTTGNSILFLNFANTWSANVVIANANKAIVTISGTDPRGQQPNISQNFYVKTTKDGSIKFVNGKAVVELTYQVTSPSGNVSTFDIIATQR